MTISEANSIPVVRRSSRGRRSRAERPHAAVGVVDAGAEQQVQKPGEQRIADVAVQPRHRARLDVLHPVADHHVGAGLQLGQEARDLLEVVGEIGVGHDDVAAPRDGEAGQVGAAVAALGLVDDDRAGGGRQPGAAVLGVVVGDDHLAVDRRGRRARPSALRTHCSIDSASLRQGITTETRAALRAGVGAGWRWT